MSCLKLKKWFSINVLLLFLLVSFILISVSVGSERIDIFDAIRNSNLRDSAILFSSRLPRTLLAAIVGIALASCGSAFQALLRNPLADPFILGVSGGAALGSVLAVGFHLSFTGISIASFFTALISIFLIFSIAKTKGRLPSHTLLLTGVIFNAFCFALILFVNSILTMEQAYQIVFLLIGNLEPTDYTTILLAAFFVLSGFIILVALAQKINILSLGDETAGHLGVDSNRLRIYIFFASSLMVGVAVATSGLIGFIGLFVPHIARFIFGSDHRFVIPASGLIGAMFLVASDTIGRTFLMNTNYQTELPVGVITALVGAPFFVVLLKRQQKAL